MDKIKELQLKKALEDSIIKRIGEDKFDVLLDKIWERPPKKYIQTLQIVYTLLIKSTHKQLTFNVILANILQGTL